MRWRRSASTPDSQRRARGARRRHSHELLEREPDAALGNGGLGRLAACFLDSIATLGPAGFGYGMRYEYGMFAQQHPRRPPGRGARRLAAATATRGSSRGPRCSYRVRFGGRVVHAKATRAGAGCRPSEVRRHAPTTSSCPATAPSASRRCACGRPAPTDPIDLAAFNRGDYVAAARAQDRSENARTGCCTRTTAPQAGRELRLQAGVLPRQRVAAGHGRAPPARARRRCRPRPATMAIHLNDTHPALAPAELMRLLLDEHGLAGTRPGPSRATRSRYTNHTLMPEALETWPVRAVRRAAAAPPGDHLRHQRALPRRRARAASRRRGDCVRRLSLIDEHGERRVRMAALAIVA